MFTRHIVKAVVLNERGELLMIRRSKTDVRRPLQWDLPGGYREPNEPVDDCMRRETLEETGLRVRSENLVYASTDVREWLDEKNGKRTENVVFLFYLVTPEEGTVRLSSEHSEYKWEPLSSAVEQYEYDLHKNVLRHIIANNLMSS